MLNEFMALLFSGNNCRLGVAVRVLAVPLGGTLEDESKLIARLIIIKRVSPAPVTVSFLNISKIQLAFLLIGIFNIGLVKLSVSFLYYRIFNKPMYRGIIATWIVLLII